MKNYQKAFSVIASVVLAGAAISAFLTKTERGKRMLAEIKKKKGRLNNEGVEAF